MTTSQAGAPSTERSDVRFAPLLQDIQHAAELLPSQGPISVFVHHNTLHAFEDLPFEQAVEQAGALYGSAAYLRERQYRDLLEKRRIRRGDLHAVLSEDLGESASEPLHPSGTRLDLRLAMLEHRHHVGTNDELRWAIADTQALGRFTASTPDAMRRRCIDRTQRWVVRDLADETVARALHVDSTLASLRASLGPVPAEWPEPSWEVATLSLLWSTSQAFVEATELPPGPELGPRHADLLREATGVDADRPVHEVLVRFCSAFADQGVAAWPLPMRERGFWPAFVALHSAGKAGPPWLDGLAPELARLESAGVSALESIEESLRLLGVDDAERPAYLTRCLLALPGWAGVLWQLEHNAEWAPHPAPAGTLVGYLAARLVLERVALAAAAASRLDEPVELSGLRSACRERISAEPAVSRLQLAWWIFQLAQALGWSAPALLDTTPEQRRSLTAEVLGFDRGERLRLFQRAYERRYHSWLLDSVLVHCDRARAADDTPAQPTYQVVACLDEREESLRRHLEELDPECETFGVAGFFGVAMYYRGVKDAHFRPLCPVSIKPVHFVEEEPAYSLEQTSQRHSAMRARIGHSARRVHVGTRGLLTGMLTALAGSVATIPMVMRVLFPRSAARLRAAASRMIEPAVTTLLLEQEPEGAGREEPTARRYTVTEMADIVAGVLASLGLTRRCAKLVVIMGHGSSSLNNPHEAAHDCGACGGGRGGPNARAFATMANDPRVRELLVERGCQLADDVVFVGAYHDTCDDSIVYADLDHLPRSHRARFEHARHGLDRARRRNAHERCRRFESASLALTPEAALQHVEGRSEDLSQTRPEYGHATNAACLVGRRDWSRGLFLDRRAFLTTYDPRDDDARGSVLEQMLRAVIPVCAGINLEYYFSYIDPVRYGCGTKLPHNISGLVGVMDGVGSDLRPGLPWQMVEIHEPMRILFVIETTAECMTAILSANPALNRLVENSWVRLAVLDPQRPAAKVYRDGRFEPYEPESTELARAPSSEAWYRGQRGHLQFASIDREGTP